MADVPDSKIGPHRNAGFPAGLPPGKENATTIGVLLLDSACVVQCADRGAEQLLGSPESQLCGRALYSVWQDLGAARAPLGSTPWVSAHAQVCTWVKSGGQRQTVIVEESRLRRAGDECVVVVLREATAWADQWLALVECRDRFEAFMEHLPGVAYMKDRDGRYVYASPTFERHFGRRREEYLGRLDAEVWPPEVVQQLRESDRTVIEHGCVVQTTERVPQKDGAHYWLATKFPIVDSAGKVVLVGGVAIDVTEEHRALESLKQLQRSAQQRERLADVGAITAQILHDLANPIAGVSMQVQLILRRAGRDPERPVGHFVAPLGRLLAEVQRLDTLLREFKDFARAQRLKLQSVRLRSLLVECVTQWRPVARARDIAVHAELAPDLPAIRADPEQLRRVLDNLIKNAIEAIEQGPGTVWVHSRRPRPDWVQVSVLDDGPGMAPHIEPFRLFETTKAYGTGLGLPIVRQVVEAHGGRIAYEPREPRGAMFHIDLPEHGPLWPVAPEGESTVG